MFNAFIKLLMKRLPPPWPPAASAVAWHSPALSLAKAWPDGDAMKGLSYAGHGAMLLAMGPHHQECVGRRAGSQGDAAPRQSLWVPRGLEHSGPCLPCPHTAKISHGEPNPELAQQAENRT